MLNKDTLTHLLSDSSETLSLNAHHMIIYKDQEIACLIKGETVLMPKIRILNTSALDEHDIRQIQNHLETWVKTHIKTVLAPLFALENLPLSGTARGIAFQVFERFGILYRKDVLDLIKPLTKEDRQALGKNGLRLGAYYVFQRDLLKPAAVKLRANLMRAFYDLKPEFTPTPPEGNVSMEVDAKAHKKFYLSIGFPVFGRTAVRVDMVERVNSAIFDGAVDGKYTFDPALASTIGVSVEAVQGVLDDLGFKYTSTTETVKNKEGEDEQKETRVYTLNKAPIKALRAKKKPMHNQSGKKPSPTKNSTKKPLAKKEADPDSPFAALQALQSSTQKS